MAQNTKKILDHIPHREPFLWVDEILESEQHRIVTTKTIPEDLDLLKGHYPGNPIVPGVLILESVFQSGALLIALSSDAKITPNTIPVLSRIGKARFKRQVLPGDTITIHVELKEKISAAWFLKGVVRIQNRITTQVEFSCTLTDKQ